MAPACAAAAAPALHICLFIYSFFVAVTSTLTYFNDYTVIGLVYECAPGIIFDQWFCSSVKVTQNVFIILKTSSFDAKYINIAIRS